ELPGMTHLLFKMKPSAVVLPNSAEEISLLIKYCADHKIPIIPRGAATSGYGGAIPVTEGIIIDTRGLNKILELDEENLTVLVESGVIWEDLLKYLELRGFTLLSYPSSARSSTVGGWVAEGGSGIGSLKHGDVKAQVNTLEVVLPNGEICNTVNGILTLKISDDVTRYFLESEGILGIITKIELRIKSKRALKKFVTVFQSLESLCSCITELTEQTAPYHIHFMEKEYVNFKIAVKREEKLPNNMYISLIVYEDDTDLENNINKFNEIVERNNGKILNMGIAEAEWKERFYPMRIKRLGPSLVPSEVYVPLSNLKDFILELLKKFKNEKLGIEGIVGSNKNVVVMTFFLDDERKQISFLMGFYRSFEVVTTAIDFEGNVYGIGIWLAKFAEKFFGKEYLAELKTLKSRLDPHKIVNPNKMFDVSTRFGVSLNPMLTLSVPLLRIGRKFFPPNRHPIFGILLLFIIIIAVISGIFWILSTFFNIKLIDLASVLLGGI
ncbi:MAG: FAD-binding oxidoreductase, partial [Promethearchaeota archaeon]